MKNEDEMIADIIDDGADYIEKNGWTQGDLYNWDAAALFPPACIMGGLLVGNTVENDVIRRSAVLYAAEKRLPMATIVERVHSVIPDLHSLAVWNDKVCQSQQEALDMMRLAAKRIRGSHE